MRVTIKYIAEMAGVSTAAVSKALNGHSDISDETKQSFNSLKLWNLDLDFDYNNRTKLNNFWLSIQK